MSDVRKIATGLTLALVAVLIAGAPLAPTRAAQRPEPYLDEIDAYIESQMRAHRIPGLALGIIEEGEIVALRGYGVAAPSGREMTAQTPVIIGSMSKSFTALAVMQLVEARDVDLDAPVQQYLPWFSLADSEASAAITVRHLLNQTSGLPNAVGLEQCLGTGEATIEETARELSTVAPAFPADDRFQYSNANFIVLGALVEAVSGESFGDYIRRHVFEPLQMHNSFASQREAEAQGMATGYRRWFGFPVPADPPYLLHALPSGYLIASAEDIAHFLTAHINGGVYDDARVLSAGGVAEMHAPAADAGEVAYGMGWVVGEAAGRHAVYHHGSTPNFHNTMLIEPEAGRGVVVLTNVNLLEVWHVGPSSVIAEGVLHLMEGEPAPTGGLSVGVRYLIADTIIAVFTALTMLSFALLPRWRRQLQDRPPHSAASFGRRVAVPVLAGAAWSLTILLAFPDISNVPAWEFWVLYQPDFAYWLIAVAGFAVLKVVLMLSYGYSAIRAAGVRIGWRKAAVASTVVLVGFVALLFGLMFAAPDLVTFVIGLLALVFILETVAQPVGRTEPSEVGGLLEGRRWTEESLLAR